MSREIEFLIRRKFVKDVVFEFEDGITIYDFIRQLKDKEVAQEKARQIKEIFKSPNPSKSGDTNR
jgi:hypothetical protein